jgi:hypothetical protein
MRVVFEKEKKRPERTVSDQRIIIRIDFLWNSSAQQK